jgi:hypothetical protein
MGIDALSDGHVDGRIRPHQFPAPDPGPIRPSFDGYSILVVNGIVRGDTFSIYPGGSLKDISNAMLGLQVLSGLCLRRIVVMI